MSVCSGAFTLGEAGLLDDRDCTTHWMHTDELADRFPEGAGRSERAVRLRRPDPDLGRHGLRPGPVPAPDPRRYGEEVARRVARRMVMPPHRDGGQAQYVDAPIRVRAADTLAPLLDELAGELEQEHSVESLAARSSMSPRTFARRFRAETGTSPHLWLTHQRVLLARRMLEEGDDPDRHGGQPLRLRHRRDASPPFRPDRGRLARVVPPHVPAADGQLGIDPVTALDTAPGGV